MSLQNILKTYEDNCARGSDINENLPVLKKFAEKVDHVTEFGVRTAQSTSALLAGSPKKMISYDIQNCSPTYLLMEAHEEGIEFEFIQADTAAIVIEETDLLFIDTAHTYDQIKAELLLHGNKARHYIIIHDTETYKEQDEHHGPGPGIWIPVLEFLENNPHWRILEHHENNNGMTVLAREST